VETPDPDDTQPSPLHTTKTIIVSSYNIVNYLYFYKGLVEGGSEYRVSTGNEFPADYDQSGTTMDTTGDGYGKIKVYNDSEAGSQIVQMRWGGFDYAVSIMPRNYKEITVPAGTSQLAFRIASKENFGASFAETVHERQTMEITYTDDFENITMIPPGMGLIRIKNYSNYPVQGLVLYTQMNTAIQRPNSTFDPAGPIGKDSSASLIVDRQPYIVQLQFDHFFIDRVLNFNNPIELIELYQEEIDDDPGKGTEDDESTVANAGSLRVYNDYMAGVEPALDMKIYKFKLTKLDASGGLPTGTTPGVDVFIWNGTGQSGTTTWDGTSNVASVYMPIKRGQNDNVFNIPEGYYQLDVVAGSYAWGVFQEGVVINGVTLDENRITYDCGEILITKKVERQYHFSVAPGKEKDTPHGSVIVYIQFTGLSTGTDYHPVAFVEIAIAPNDRRSQNSGGSVEDSNTNLRKFSWWPTVLTGGGTNAGWKNLQEGPYADEAQTILKYTGVLNYNNTTAGPFVLPPGPYYGRYGDTYNKKGRVYGAANSTHWRDFDLRSFYNRTITISLDPTSGFSWLEGSAF
jgi:hypothetical protein